MSEDPEGPPGGDESADGMTAEPASRNADEPAAETAPPGSLTEAELEALLFVAERPLSRREIGAFAGVDRETVDEPAPPGSLTEAELEALLFVAERPLSRREIGAFAGVDRETVDERLGDLEVSLAGRGIRLALSGDRVELVTAPDAGVLIARFVGADAVRLSPAGLETLAIVAYRQPITKGGVERIRGVDSDYSIRALVHRRLVVELGRSESPGRPILYGTGFEFLERFGLTTIEDLPPLDPEVAARLVDGPDGTGDPAANLAAMTIAASRPHDEPVGDA